MWAPDSPDGPGALHSCIEGLPGGGFCPWLRMQAAWGVQSETCCGCGGCSQETLRPGLTRQQEELAPAEPVITSLSSSGCTTSPGPSWE